MPDDTLIKWLASLSERLTALRESQSIEAWRVPDGTLRSYLELIESELGPLPFELVDVALPVLVVLALCYYDDDVELEAVRDSLKRLDAYIARHRRDQITDAEMIDLVFAFCLGVGDLAVSAPTFNAFWSLVSLLLFQEHRIERELTRMGLEGARVHEVRLLADYILGKPAPTMFDWFQRNHPGSTEADFEARQRRSHMIEGWLNGPRTSRLSRFLYIALGGELSKLRGFEKGLLAPFLRIGDEQLRFVPVLVCCGHDSHKCGALWRSFEICESCGVESPRFKKVTSLIRESDDRYIESWVWRCQAEGCKNFTDATDEPLCQKHGSDASQVKKQTKRRRRKVRVFRFAEFSAK